MKLKRDWYKILGCLLILYSIVFGFLIPLKPGIALVDPGFCKSGTSLTLQIQGYNSNYAENVTQAWLKLDSLYFLKATSTKSSSDNLLTAIFEIPKHHPTKDTVVAPTLVLSNEIDGTSVLPAAVFITQSEIQPSLGISDWTKSDLNNIVISSAFTFPFRNILEETIRNTYFHVPLWMAMMVMFIISCFHSVNYLRFNNIQDDIKATAYTRAGVLYGILGLLTGALWAKYTWGAYWSFDIKQNMAAVAMLIYLAYFVLRGSFDDFEKRNRIAAAYNIFAFATLIPLLYIIPRLVDSLHPGSGGNPAMGSEDLDNTMRTIFYPAVIGWILFGAWISNLYYRVEKIKHHIIEN